MNQKDTNVRKASSPWLDNRPPHLPCQYGELPEAVLLPGDPARVDRFSEVLDQFRIIGSNREYRIGVGKFEGVNIGVCSTGIGGPSTEIALVEAAQLGCRYALRIGGTGALRDGIALGSLLVVERALRGGGAAAWYSAPYEPANAHPVMQSALLDVVRERNIEYTLATVRSVDGYYAGQGRNYPFAGPNVESVLEDYRKEGVDALDMESETVLVIGQKLGMVSGSLLAVHANRSTDGWLEAFGSAQEDMILVACDALKRIMSEKPK